LGVLLCSVKKENNKINELPYYSLVTSLRGV